MVLKPGRSWSSLEVWPVENVSEEPVGLGEPVCGGLAHGGLTVRGGSHPEGVWSVEI